MSEAPGRGLGHGATRWGLLLMVPAAFGQASISSDFLFLSDALYGPMTGVARLPSAVYGALYSGLAFCLLGLAASPLGTWPLRAGLFCGLLLAALPPAGRLMAAASWPDALPSMLVAVTGPALLGFVPSSRRFLVLALITLYEHRAGLAFGSSIPAVSWLGAVVALVWLLVLVLASRAVSPRPKGSVETVAGVGALAVGALPLTLSVLFVPLGLALAHAGERVKRIGLGALLVLTGLWAADIALPALRGPTIYPVDTPAAIHHAADLLLAGQNPYIAFDHLDAVRRFGVPDLFISRRADGEWLRTFHYPAGSFLTAAPFLGIPGTNLRHLYAGALLAVLLLLFVVAPGRFKLLALGLGAVLHQLTLWFVIGAYPEPLVVLLMLLAWLWRDRPLLGGLSLGCAIAIKQNAWPFVPFYGLALLFRHGFRRSAAGCAVAGAVFLLSTVPLIGADLPAWMRLASSLGVLLPMPMGFGLAQVGASVWPGSAAWFTAAVPLTWIGALLAYWRWGRQAPELALVLPWLPLWFGWSSTYNYYYLLPVQVAFGIALSSRTETPTSGQPQASLHTLQAQA